ncbi:MAG: iron ABC transporter permease [Bacteroidales bacterium]|nr:iron ABC transporter permease [Candidatus Physcousia equi]
MNPGKRQSSCPPSHQASSARRLISHRLRLALLLLLVVGVAVANIVWGSIHIPLSSVVDILMGNATDHPAWRYIVIENRIPQVVTAMLTGACLATGGLLLQTTFRNPLAGPSILGIDSGANLAVAIVMLLLGGMVTIGSMSLSGHLLIVAAAMLGAWAVMLLLLAFSRKVQSHLMLLITGVMVSYLAGSLISLLNFSATAEGVQAFMVWGMGNFNGVSLDRLPLFATLCLVGLLAALMLIKPLNALLLGDHYATNLGYRTRPLRTRLLLVTGLLTATSTAFCGPISFLGLAVPHLARLLSGTHDHRLLLPSTMLMGSLLALLCNLVSNLPSAGTIIPINVITPIIGAPIVLWVILRQR